MAVGATVSTLRQRHFENLPVVVASPSEQHRIVAILDEAFKAIATVTTNSEKNLVNAREIFGAYLNRAFERERKNWLQITVADAGTLRTGSTPASSEQAILAPTFRLSNRAIFARRNA